MYWLLVIPAAWAVSSLVVLGSGNDGADSGAQSWRSAHFHTRAGAPEHHWHGGIEHHPHEAGDGAIEVADDDERRRGPAEKRTAAVTLDTLPDAPASTLSRVPAPVIAFLETPQQAVHAPGPPERPPAVVLSKLLLS